MESTCINSPNNTQRDSLDKITSVTYYIVGGICFPLSIIVIINLCKKPKGNDNVANEIRFILLSIFVTLLFHSIADLIPAKYEIEKAMENTLSQFLNNTSKSNTINITKTNIANIYCTLEASLLSLSIICFLGNGLTVSYSVYKMIFVGNTLKKELVKMCLLYWIISIVLTLFELSRSIAIVAKVL